MTIHTFRTTGAAYDACQCDAGVRTGDVLLIPSEGVVGLAWAWPVAVTLERGELHTVTPTLGAATRVALDAKWTEEQVNAAVQVAMDLGLPVRAEWYGFGKAKR